MPSETNRSADGRRDYAAPARNMTASWNSV